MMGFRTTTIQRHKHPYYHHRTTTTTTTTTTPHHPQKLPPQRFVSTTPSSVLFRIPRGGGGGDNLRKDDGRSIGSSSFSTSSSSSSWSSSSSSSRNNNNGASKEPTTTTTTTTKKHHHYHRVYIAVGANTGNRFRNILNALEKLHNTTPHDILLFDSKQQPQQQQPQPPPPPAQPLHNHHDDDPTQQGPLLVRNIRTSFLRETAPMYMTDQPRFLNGAVCCETLLSPHTLLKRLKSIEAELGRDLVGPDVIPNGPRPVDLDILACHTYPNHNNNHNDDDDDDDEGGGGGGGSYIEDDPWFAGTVVQTETLTIPHPRIGEREFVLSPLCDLTEGGRLIVPGLEGTVQEMLRRLVRRDDDDDDTSNNNNNNGNEKEEEEEEEEEDDAAVHVLCLPRNRTLPLHKTVVMGILNTTPDSFSDGGQYDSSTDVAVAHALKMIEDGAGIIDIGGESTRPGAKEVDVELELERVVPVIAKLREVSDIPISIDTRHATVARAAILAGADIINDVSGGTFDPQMLSTAASLQVPYILMHSRGTPETMQNLVNYSDDVVADVAQELEERVERAMEAGIQRWNLVLDPGIGFAKGYRENLVLMGGMDRLRGGRLKGFPFLLGPSRKRFVGQLVGEEDDPERRDYGTVAACVLGMTSLGDGRNDDSDGGGYGEIVRLLGGTILRVHNVKAAKDAAAVTEAILKANRRI